MHTMINWNACLTSISENMMEEWCVRCNKMTPAAKENIAESKRANINMTFNVVVRAYLEKGVTYKYFDGKYFILPIGWANLW